MLHLHPLLVLLELTKSLADGALRLLLLSSLCVFSRLKLLEEGVIGVKQVDLLEVVLHKQEMQQESLHEYLSALTDELVKACLADGRLLRNF